MACLTAVSAASEVVLSTPSSGLVLALVVTTTSYPFCCWLFVVTVSEADAEEVAAVVVEADAEVVTEAAAEVVAVVVAGVAAVVAVDANPTQALLLLS